MKNSLLLLVFVLLTSLSCKDAGSYEAMPEITTADLAKYKMKILPEAPSSGDEVRLVVYEECRYNTLKWVNRNGSIIEIEKQFNSMIMAPCLLTNDTILIGKLPGGTYRINYKLIDIAYQPAGKISFELSFKLVVSK